jgi:hypothetical protein
MFYSRIWQGTYQMKTGRRQAQSFAFGTGSKNQTTPPHGHLGDKSPIPNYHGQRAVSSWW